MLKVKIPGHRVIGSFGGAFGVISEPHRRGIGLGIALHSDGNRVQALPAGGNIGTRTQDLSDVNRTL